MPRKKMSRSREDGLVRLATLVLLAGCVGVGAYIWLNGRTGDVSNPGVEFNEPGKKRPFRIRAETFVWPMYGYDAARTRNLPVRLRPPFSQVWRFNANQLLEFSPILARGTLYTVRKDSRIYAIDAKTGHRKWTKKVGSLSAASPGYSRGRIFVVTLSGRIVALNAQNGHIRWARDLGSRSESSPLMLGDSVIFGSESGKLYRLRQSDGRIEWTYAAGGAIKGGPAYYDGKVFVGAYGGTVHAIRAGNGARVWRASTSGARFGFGSGNFYATPSVAYGRVFVGNTDGKVYSFSASSGRLAWSKGTGAFVYGATAVDDVSGVGPTVFVGSYDGNFYALNARTGGVRWTYAAGGQISGAPTVIGDIVYFATKDTTNTYGLSTRSGKRVFARGSGAYNPVISDGHRIYLTGYESVSAFVRRSDFKREEKERRAALRSR
ncbi:MAG: PQQ-binding-like beta-propeller repeat protein [Actinobacteria bacterium]|nr:PQQ-binding-like beta-propeller repeat protein [Actinomycetota bacterium]